MNSVAFNRIAAAVADCHATDFTMWLSDGRKLTGTWTWFNEPSPNLDSIIAIVEASKTKRQVHYVHLDHVISVSVVLPATKGKPKKEKAT